MGQRTQIILVTEDFEGNKSVRIYHDQWGIGRKPILNIMDVFHRLYNRERFKSITDTVFMDEEASGICLEYETRYDGEGGIVPRETSNGVEQLDIPFRSFLEPSEIGKILTANCDNNNGALVIHIKEERKPDRFFPECNFRFGFLMGEDDACDEENSRFGEEFSRWLSLEEWCSLPINMDYADERFVKVVSEFVGYFGLEEFCNTDTKNTANL